MVLFDAIRRSVLHKGRAREGQIQAGGPAWRKSANARAALRFTMEIHHDRDAGAVFKSLFPALALHRSLKAASFQRRACIASHARSRCYVLRAIFDGLPSDGRVHLSGGVPAGKNGETRGKIGFNRPSATHPFPIATKLSYF